MLKSNAGRDLVDAMSRIGADVLLVLVFHVAKGPVNRLVVRVKQGPVGKLPGGRRGRWRKGEPRVKKALVAQLMTATAQKRKM